MTIRIESIEDVRYATGLRLVGIRGVPSPWTESVKAIFLTKNLGFRYAERDDQSSTERLVDWVGDASIPVVAFENEAPRFDWLEILLLAERLEASPCLLPKDTAMRADAMGVATAICGKMGLGWCYRLLMINQALSSSADDGAIAEGAFPTHIASYLASRYGYESTAVAQARTRVMEVLTVLSSRLGSSRYLIADTLSAVDIYWAMFSNLMIPMDAAQLEFDDRMRSLYNCIDSEVLNCISKNLRNHQRRIFEEHLTLPWRV